MRKRSRYANRLRELPGLTDLSLTEARLAARLVDVDVVDGERVLVLGIREREALIAAIPRLGPRLQSLAERPSSTPTSAPSSRNTSGAVGSPEPESTALARSSSASSALGASRSSSSAARTRSA